MKAPLGHDPREGAPERAEALMRNHPLEPYVEFPAGRDPCEAFAEIGFGPACDFASRGRKWRPPWGTIRVRGVPNWARARVQTCKTLP